MPMMRSNIKKKKTKNKNKKRNIGAKRLAATKLLSTTNLFCCLHSSKLAEETRSKQRLF
jgi:hypothetical protein